MDKVIACLEAGTDIKNNMENWTTSDIEFLNDYQLLTGKPCMFAINLNKKDYCRKKNKYLKPIFEWVNKHAPGSTMIPYCGSYEEELQDMESDAAREAQLKEDDTSSAMKNHNYSLPHGSFDKFFHLRSRRDEGMDYSQRLQGSTGGRLYPHGLRKKIHQGGGHGLRRPQAAWL